MNDPMNDAMLEDMMTSAFAEMFVSLDDSPVRDLWIRATFAAERGDWEALAGMLPTLVNRGLHPDMIPLGEDFEAAFAAGSNIAMLGSLALAIVGKMASIARVSDDVRAGRVTDTPSEKVRAEVVAIADRFDDDRRNLGLT